MAAPFLGSVGERTGRAQSLAPPRRLIVMFTYYGCITTRWFPQKSHGVLTEADLEPTTLKHLAPHVKKLLMPRGIRAMNEWTVDMTLGQGNDPYANVAGSYFTCQPLTPNSNDPLSGPASTHFAPLPIGPSLDHVMAQQLSPDALPLVVRVGNFSTGSQIGTSFSAAEQKYPGIGSPNQLYTVLTGLFSGGAPVSPDSYRALRGQSVLDLVKADLETLERFDMSQSDRDKLAAWKELLSSTTPAVTEACSGAQTAMLGLTEGSVAAASGPLQDRVASQITDSLDAADLYANLVVLAAACDANPILFMSYPPAWIYRGLGIEESSPGLAQRTGSANMEGACFPNAIDKLLVIDDFHARKFAHLVGALDGIAEGDGTLLDSTATVWFQEVSDGAARNLNNLPILQAGGCGGYFQTGHAINVENGSDDLTRGSSEAVCGPDAPSNINNVHKLTGTDRSLANAPINKYFCNLMNALGVKAGEDGFPLQGGSAEVTHFGRYDRTEDFIGGDVNPPAIHDPGEFAQLKAGS